MKSAELRQKTKPELQKMLQDNRERLRQLRFDLVSGKVKNVREIRKIKKEIARILTIINEFTNQYEYTNKKPKSTKRFVNS